MFALQDSRGAVTVAFTDRLGGVSGWEASASNPFAGRAGVPGPRRVVTMRQVHGSHVHLVGPENVGAMHDDPPVADALVTGVPGVVLAVRVADCAPVLLADPERKVVAAAHAGRAGLVAGIVPTTIEAMRETGARHILAWVGPHVCGRCYEVPEDMRAEVARVLPEAYGETSWGTPAVDIGAGLRAQLDAHGVEVTGVPRCTVEDEDLYSYRREGPETGRMAGLVWIRP